MKFWRLLLLGLQLFVSVGASTMTSAEEAKDSRQEQHKTFLEQHKNSHEKRIIERRAKVKSETPHGRTSYTMTVIDSYEDCAALKELGNILANGSVRNIYNVTKVTDPRLRASKCPLLIGNIYLQGKAREISNYVEIEGSVTSHSKDVLIGNITLDNATVDTTKSLVEIGGSIEIK